MERLKKIAEVKRLADEAAEKEAEIKRLAVLAEEKRQKDVKAAEDELIRKLLADAKTKGWINPAVKPVESDCD